MLSNEGVPETMRQKEKRLAVKQFLVGLVFSTVIGLILCLIFWGIFGTIGVILLRDGIPEQIREGMQTAFWCGVIPPIAATYSFYLYKRHTSPSAEALGTWGGLLLTSSGAFGLYTLSFWEQILKWHW